MLFQKNKIPFQSLSRGLSTVVGVVLIWRGIWYVLDAIDKIFFNGSHILTAIGGIMLGLIILYLPDKDIKELEKL